MDKHAIDPRSIFLYNGALLVLYAKWFESIDRIGEEFPIFIMPSDHQNNVEHVVLMLKNIIGPIFEIVCMPLRKEILMEKIKRNATLFDCLLAWQQEHDTL